MIEPIGNAPIVLALNEAQGHARKLRNALAGTAIVTAIILFLAWCRTWILAHLNITEAAFKIAGGIILCLTVVAEGCLNEKNTMVFLPITAIMLTGFSVQYVLDGISISRLLVP